MAIKRSQSGFTLVELIIVIVLVGFLATMTTDIITLPVKSYLDLERRTTLADTADSSLRRMQRDIRRALPNSIRITDSETSIEFLHISDGGRYRAKLDSDCNTLPLPSHCPVDTLDFNSEDTTFDVLGALNQDPTGSLVIYNLSARDSVANAYTGDNLVLIADNRSTKVHIDLQSLASQGKTENFPLTSPQQRFFIVDTPITYNCKDGELRRYSNYTITSSPPNLNSLTYNLLAKTSAISCVFTYDPGTNTRAGLIKLSLRLTDKANESANLVMQVHVDNMP